MRSLLGKKPQTANKPEKENGSNSEETDSEIEENQDKNYDFLNSDGFSEKICTILLYFSLEKWISMLFVSRKSGKSSLCPQ